MPIDPSIPLQVKNPEFATPMQTMGKVLTLQSALQNQQLQRERLNQYRLQNEAREKQLQADKDLAALVTSHTTPDPSGQPVTDHNAVVQGLLRLGHTNTAYKYDADRRANAAADLKTQIDQTTIEKGKRERLGSIFGSYDPQKPETYAAALNLAAQEKLMDPKVAQQWIADGPEAHAPHFGVVANAAMTAAQQDAAKIRLMDFNHKVLMDAPKTAKAWTDRLAQTLKESGTQQEWDATLASAKKEGAPDSVISQFGAYSDDAPTRAAGLGMTPMQSQTAAHQDAMEDQGQLRIDQGDERLRQNQQRIDQARGGSAKQDELTKRENMRELSKLQVNEGKYHRIRRSLGNAISTGQLYVDRLGGVKSLDIVAAENQTTKDALLQDMKDRYADATDELKKIIAEKNERGATLGKTIGTTTEDAWKALDDGDAKLFGTPAAPGAKPSPAAAAKPAAAPQQWTVKDKTGKTTVYTKGQEVMSGGKRYRVTGYVNGQIQAEPLD